MGLSKFILDGLQLKCLLASWNFPFLWRRTTADGKFYTSIYSVLSSPVHNLLIFTCSLSSLFKVNRAVMQPVFQLRLLEMAVIYWIIFVRGEFLSKLLKFDIPKISNSIPAHHSWSVILRVDYGRPWMWNWALFSGPCLWVPLSDSNDERLQHQQLQGFWCILSISHF